MSTKLNAPAKLAEVGLESHFEGSGRLGSKAAESRGDYQAIARCAPARPDLESELGAGVGRIEPHSCGLFDPVMDGGIEAKFYPVRDAQGLLIDIAAVEFGARRPWWLRLGIGKLLGQSSLDRALWFDRPIMLVETPDRWLCDPRGTVCILDWDADICAMLSQGHVLCDTRRLAFRLRRAIEQQMASRAPKIGLFQ